MQPDPSEFIRVTGISIPLVGLYDAPEIAPFEPLKRPGKGDRVCIFAFFKSWLEGETTLLTEDAFGCGGCGRQFFGVEMMPRKDFLDFLVDGEGLKASRKLMDAWLEETRTYRPEHGYMLMGPLRPDQYEFLRSATFFVNPDQLAMLVYGANYHSAPGDPPSIKAPFSSGCGQLLTQFDDLSIPQAVIGATDVAMRSFLPPDIIAFTVTKAMFERICSLGRDSFLHKQFWKDLMKARGRQKKRR
jgi:hypothetical protein